MIMMIVIIMIIVITVVIIIVILVTTTIMIMIIVVIIILHIWGFVYHFTNSNSRKSPRFLFNNILPEGEIQCSLFGDPSFHFLLKLVGETIVKSRIYCRYYVKLDEKSKNRKLNDLLDALEFNQVSLSLYMYIHIYKHVYIYIYIYIYV